MGVRVGKIAAVSSRDVAIGTKQPTAEHFFLNWMDTRVRKPAQGEADRSPAQALAAECRTDAAQAGISIVALNRAVNRFDGGGSGLEPLLADALALNVEADAAVLAADDEDVTP